MKTLAVVNPNSSNGSTGREWPEIRSALRAAIGEFEQRFTGACGEATQIVQASLAQGYERILSVGGDGTNNEIVNGFFRDGEPINRLAQLGFVPRGTGGDLRKTLRIGRKLTDCLPVLQRGHLREVDVGLASFVDPQGTPCKRHFINITSFGIGGLVDKLVNQSSKALGGKASFMIGTLRAMLKYRNKLVRLRVDDVFDETIRINNVAVANGQYFGGGMRVAPEAALDDGFFDVVILGDMNLLDMARLTSTIYKGEHLRLAKVQHLRGRHIEATSDSEVLIDMDGEQPGRLPMSFDLLPKAIRVIAP